MRRANRLKKKKQGKTDGATHCSSKTSFRRPPNIIVDGQRSTGAERPEPKRGEADTRVPAAYGRPPGSLLTKNAAANWTERGALRREASPPGVETRLLFGDGPQRAKGLQRSMPR